MKNLNTDIEPNAEHVLNVEHPCFYNAPVQCEQLREKCIGCIYKPKKSPSGGLHLSDIIGMQEAKEILLRRTIEVVKHKKQLIERKATVSKGILLYGFPGTGKTTLAKALAAEIMETNPNVAFEQITLSDLSGSTVSSADIKIKGLFTKWRWMSDKEWIILLDEVDGIIPDRNKVRSVLTHERISSFLRELDGIHVTNNVYFIATTNIPFSVDGAILRAGRIDNRIFVDLPHESDRIELLKYYLRDINIENKDRKIESIAANTENHSGADFSRMRSEIILMEETRKDTNPAYKLTDEDMTMAVNRCRRPLGVNIDKMRSEYLLFQDQDS